MRRVGREWAFWLAVLLVFGGALWLRAQTLTDLWNTGHGAWGGAFYGNVARNFLRYGYGATAFAPVVNSGLVDASQFELYYHHPPLTMWLTGLSFQLFGVHEWAARLFPLLFSLLTVGLVFRMAWAAFGRGTALGAALFLAVLPIDAYYGTHLDPNSSMSIFFTTLVVEGYRRWRASGRTRDYVLCVAALVLGCATGWYTYLILPGLLAHFWLGTRTGADPGVTGGPAASRAMWLRVGLLPAAAVVVMGLFFLHRDLAFTSGRVEVFDTIGERFLYRTVNFGSDRLSIMTVYFRRIGTMYTPAFVALAAAWFVVFLRDCWTRRTRSGDWYIAILLSYGFLYALAFPGHLPGHDFFVRTYAPGIALASAVVLSRAARLIGPPAVRAAALGVLVIAVCAAAISRTETLYAWEDRTNGPLLRGFGDAVATVTSPREPVFLPIPSDAVMQFYLDRPTTFELDTPEKLAAAAGGATGRYVIAVPERNAHELAEVLTYLRQRYPERRTPGLFIFEGASSAAD